MRKNAQQELIVFCTMWSSASREIPKEPQGSRILTTRLVVYDIPNPPTSRKLQERPQALRSNATLKSTLKVTSFHFSPFALTCLESCFIKLQDSCKLPAEKNSGFCYHVNHDFQSPCWASDNSEVCLAYHLNSIFVASDNRLSWWYTLSKSSYLLVPAENEERHFK